VLIFMGAWLRRIRFLEENFWSQAERLGYYVLLPARFLHSLATAELDNVPVQGMIKALVFSTVMVAVLMVGARRIIKGNDAAVTSVFQGGVRFNNYVGVSVVAGLIGAQGIALAAVANAAIVPTVNILCVLVL
jgi:predicted permease